MVSPIADVLKALQVVGIGVSCRCGPSAGVETLEALEDTVMRAPPGRGSSLVADLLEASEGVDIGASSECDPSVAVGLVMFWFSGSEARRIGPRSMVGPSSMLAILTEVTWTFLSELKVCGNGGTMAERVDCSYCTCITCLCCSLERVSICTRLPSSCVTYFREGRFTDGVHNSMH